MKTIEELRAAHAATTQGEWDWHLGTSVEQDDFTTVEVRRDGEQGDVEILLEGTDTQVDNVEFIALAHNEFPAMLDEIEQQRQKLYQWDSVFAHLGDTPDAIGNLIRDEYDKRDNEIEQLKDEVSTLTNAARAVRDNWESGDLAGAVNRLSVLLED